MTFHVPGLITLDVGRASAGRQTKREPLCIDEMLSLVGELADLGVARMRLLLSDASAFCERNTRKPSFISKLCRAGMR